MEALSISAEIDARESISVSGQSEQHTRDVSRR